MTRKSGTRAHEGKMVAIRYGAWQPALRPLPLGTALAVIGDVHGQGEHLQALLQAISSSIEALGPARAQVVLLGDLIDRGPDSIMAIDLAMRGVAGATCLALRGNHEDLLLNLLEDLDEASLISWLSSGGMATLEDMGFSQATLSPERLQPESLAEALGPERVAFLRGMPLHHRIGDLFMVHAGIDAERALAHQRAHDLLWIREPFLLSDGPYAEGVGVIHGHTPVRVLDTSHPHRLNLDTGAFATGILTAMLFWQNEMQPIQAIGEAAEG